MDPPPVALKQTLVLCFLAALCEGFDIQAAGVAAAGIGRDFHLTAGALGLFFSASGAGLMAGALVGGYVADRVGRRAVLIASIGAFGVFSVLTSFAVGLTSLIGVRLLTGLGLGAAMPNLIALAADTSQSKSRNASIALSYVGMPFGGGIASLVAVFVPLESWRLVFLAGGAAPLLVLPFMLRYLPRTKSVTSASVSAPGNREGVLRVLFAEGRAPDSLLLWVSFFLIVLTLHLMLNWLPLLLIGRGLTRGHAVMAQAAFNVGGALAALWVGSLLDSRRRRIAIVASVSILPVVTYLMAVSTARFDLLLGLALLLGSTILAQQVILYAVASVVYPEVARGTGVGSAVAMGRVGSLAGPLFAASLLAGGRNPSQVLFGVLPIVLACGIVVAYLGWRQLGSGASHERRFS